MTLLTDLLTGRALSVDLWATEADLVAESAWYREQVAQIKDLLVTLPLAQIYEVSVQAELSQQGTARISGI